MATWYYDPENGDANNTGDSWSVDASGDDGVANGTTTFTTATGGLTGMAGRYMRISGTLKKIESVESDTSCTLDSTFISGSGMTWVIGGPVDGYSGLPYSTYMADGDVVKYPKTGGWESAGTITYTSKSDEVVIGSGRVALIDDCEGVWTGDANVTVSQGTSTYAMFGTYSLKMVIASAFTTGKLAYFDFGAGNEKDLSAFQGASMFLRNGNPIKGLQLCLCSDATGDVVVDTIDVIPSGNQLYAGSWIQPHGFKNGGGNLGSSIRSIAFYASEDPGTPTLYIDNIYAILDESNPNHICHNCLIGQGNTLADHMWAIMGFTDATHVKLVGPWYGGTEGAVASYRVEPRYLWGSGFTLSARSSGLQYGQEILNSGGWDPSTDTQDGVTCWRLMPSGSSYYRAVGASSFTHWAVERFIFTQGLSLDKYDNCIRIENCGFVGTTNQTSTVLSVAYPSYTGGGFQAHVTFRNLWFTAMNSYAIDASNSGITGIYGDQLIDWVMENVTIYSALTGGISSKDLGKFRGKNIKISNVGSRPWYLYQANVDMDIVGLEMKDNANGTGAALQASRSAGRMRIRNLVASGNTKTFQPGNVEFILYNPDIDDATLYDETMGERSKIALLKRDGDPEDHLIYTSRGTISSELSVRHTASDIAWKFSPTNTEGLPMKHKLAEIALEAGAPATIGLYMRRDSADVNARLLVVGGWLLGMTDADYVGDLEAAANIWELVTVSLTPTETGVVEVWVEAWGGTTNNVYVDDLSVTV